MRPPRRNPRAAKTYRRRIHYVLAGLTLAVLLGLGINLRLLLDPDEIRRRATTSLDGLFTGPVTVDEAEVRIPNVVILRGVRIAPPDRPDEPVLTFESVRVGFSLLGALAGRTGPRQLVFDGATLMVERRADGSLDITDLIKPPDDEENVRLPNVILRRGRLIYRDAALLRPGRTLTLADVAFDGHPDGSILGEGRLEGLGRLSVRYEDAGAHVRVRLYGLRLESPFEEIFTEEVGQAIAHVGAEGPAAIEASADLISDEVIATTVRLELLGVSMSPPVDPGRPDGPRLHLTDMRGDVVVRDDGSLTVEDVTATSPHGRFLLRGEIRDPGEAASVDLRLRGRGVVIGDTIRHLLPADGSDILDVYQPWLMGDLEMRLVREGPDGPLRPVAAFDVRAGRIRYEGWFRDEYGRRLGFPYPLNDLTGRLRYEAGNVFIEGARGGNGSTRIQAAGDIHFETLERADVDVSILARDVDVNDELKKALGDRAAYVLEPYEVAGTAAQAHVRVIQDVEDEDGARTLVTVDLDGKASVRPREFPLSVRNMTGQVRLAPDPESETDQDRVTIEALRGDGPDGSRVRLDGWIRGWGSSEEEQKLEIAVTDATLGESLDRIVASSKLDATIRDTWKLLEAQGALDAEIELREGAAGSHHDLRFTVRGGSLARLPGLTYPLTDVHGVLRIVDGEFDLTGASAAAGSGRVTGLGTIDGAGTVDFHLDVRALPTDGPLRRVLEDVAPDVDAVWERLKPRPTGRVDLALAVRLPADGADTVSFTIRKPELDLDPRKGVHLAIRDGSAEVDLALGSVKLAGWKGKLNDAAVLIDGGRKARTEGVTLRITSDPLVPGRDLAGLLSVELTRALDGFLAGGRVALDPLVVAIEDSTIRLDGSKLVLFRAEGESRGLSPRGRLTIADLLVRPDEDASIFRGRIDLTGLDLVAGIPIDGLQGRVAFSGTSGAETVISGQAENLRGRLWGRSLSDGKVKFNVEDDTVRLEDLTGGLDGGTIDGRISARLASPDALRVALRLGSVELDRFLTPTDGRPGPGVGGRLDARLSLGKEDGGLENLKGEGEVVIREGELWDIPVFSAIFGALSAVPPIEYRPVFHSADVKFDVRGDIVRMREMEFRSDLLTLERGRGTVSLFGDVDLTLVPKVQTIDIPGLSDLWSLIKGELVYRVRVKGSLERPTALLEPLPFLHGEPSTAPRVVPEFLGKIRKKRGLGL